MKREMHPVKGIDEKTAEDVVTFFLRKTYGQDACAVFHQNDRHHVKVKTSAVEYYLFAFKRECMKCKDGSWVPTDDYENVCAGTDLKRKWRNFLKNIVHYADKGWYIAVLPYAKHVFDENSSIEEAFMHIDLEKMP